MGIWDAHNDTAQCLGSHPCSLHSRFQVPHNTCSGRQQGTVQAVRRGLCHSLLEFSRHVCPRGAGYFRSKPTDMITLSSFFFFCFSQKITQKSLYYLPQSTFLLNAIRKANACTLTIFKKKKKENTVLFIYFRLFPLTPKILIHPEKTNKQKPNQSPKAVKAGWEGRSLGF